MVKKLFERFKGDRKYFTVVFFILILIILSGLVTPLIINQQRENWDYEIKLKTADIENSIKQLIEEKEYQLLQTKDWLKTNLKKTLRSESYQYKELIELVNNPLKKDYSIEVIAPNGKLIAWNEIIAQPQEEIFPLTYPLGETYFYTGGLTTFFTIVDTVHIQNDVFYLVVSNGIEKHYQIRNQYFSNESFEKEISDKFSTPCTIDYNPFTSPSKDGRIYSFVLMNYRGTKIGQVNFYKPSLNVSITDVHLISAKIQSALVFLACILIGLGFRKEFLNIRFRSFKFLLLIVYIGAFRVLIYTVDFPSMFVSGFLVDPANFSSKLGWGLVKSPLELFITNFFLVIIGFQLFSYVYQYFQKGKDKILWPFKILAIPILLLIFFYLIRGLSASIKSVIFDSSIRYFRDPTPIPDLITLFMNLNVLMLGLAIVLVMVALLILCGLFAKVHLPKYKLLKHLLYFFCVQVIAYFFFDYLPEPLISPVLVIIIITIIYIVIYIGFLGRQDLPKLIVYCTLAASIISVILMNYFNLELERKSLRTVASEIIRANENLLHYMSDETLRKSLTNEKLLNSFLQKNINYDAEAFELWVSSPMQKESISSGIFLYDAEEKEIGNFSVGLEHQYAPLEYFDILNYGEPSIIEITDSLNEDVKTYIGVIPVVKRDIVSGYIASVIEFNIHNIGSKNIPDFLKSDRALLGSAIDASLLKIFEFRNSHLVQVYGDIYPSREQIAAIFNAKLSVYNDAWINFSIYSEDYIAYVIKLNEDGDERLITVAAKENEITWNLFNFFKIFLLHALFIFILLIFLKITNLLRIKSSFRTRLLYAFLVVAIVPLALLAVYNREVVSERSEEAIFNELNKRSDYLINHVNSQLSKHNDRELVAAFRNAGKELNISFAVYQNTDLLYSSREELYRTGLFNYKLNSEAYYNLNYLSYREHLSREKLDKYYFDAYYRKAIINGASLVIGVNDAFNKIKPAFSTSDVDVILFGIYSFAVILIIIVSTLLANQISAPIRKLTKATEVVAKGDLDVELVNKEKGEMKDLYDGFNMMTKELRKNQIELAELERETAWKEMAKQVAHEIKNPLTPIKLAIQQLKTAHKDKSEDFDKIFRKVIKTTLNQIDSMSQIASEFSSFAKMPSIKLEVLDIVPVVEDTINLFIDDKISFDFECEVIEAVVEGDKSQIRRMLINMIRNSIQANAKEVKVKLNLKQDDYSILISDNGEGINTRYKDKIFDMNFTTKEKGMGLGLKLVKRFLEGINGSITLVDSNTFGTKFEIIIPKYKSAQNGRC